MVAETARMTVGPWWVCHRSYLLAYSLRACRIIAVNILKTPVNVKNVAVTASPSGKTAVWK
jgi:hypothetical protein